MKLLSKQIPAYSFCLGILVLAFLCLPLPCLAQDQDQKQEEYQDFMEDLLEEYDTQSGTSDEISDPLYHFNHAMYVFNDTLYFYGLKPVAMTYNAVLPQMCRRGISHFFYHLMFPVRFVNQILQGDLCQAKQEMDIFLVNTVAGFLGFAQPAQNNFGLVSQKQDLGKTLGRWGMGKGCYLVLPVLGPSSVRDAIGQAGDLFLTPVHYLSPWHVRLEAQGLDKINEAGFHIGDYEALKAAALDPYAALRNAFYVQQK